MYKILSLVWFKIYPARFGGQKGIAEFNEYLSQYYDAIDCLCASENEVSDKTKVQILPELPNNKWQFLNPLVWNKIYHRFKKGSYTHVVIEFPYYGYIGALLKRKGAFYILHAHNIEGERLKNWRLFLKLR